jgi:hypothetical protein
MTSTIPATPIPTKRRFLRFSLRAMLLLILVVAAALGWLIREARKQAIAVAALEEMGCSVEYGYAGSPSMIERLRKWLGDSESRNVIGVSIHETTLTGARLTPLRELTCVESLWLAEIPVTDADLVNLNGLGEMHYLSLSKTKLTDAGLSSFKGMKQLYRLDLSGTAVTDAGLVQLHGLTQLVELELSETQVTDTGVERLQTALPQCQIDR